MTSLRDEDDQILAYSRWLSKTHTARLGPSARTWTCPKCAQVNRQSKFEMCLFCAPMRMAA